MMAKKQNHVCIAPLSGGSIQITAPPNGCVRITAPASGGVIHIVQAPTKG